VDEYAQAHTQEKIIVGTKYLLPQKPRQHNIFIVPFTMRKE